MRLCLLIGILAASLVYVPGCSDDDCKTNADCPTGRICRLGLCALDPMNADTLVPADFDGNLECDAAGSTDFVMNEILADPPVGSGLEEFIELVNVSSKEVGLSNVTIDISGTQIPAGIVCVPPNGAWVIGPGVSLGLNNSGETVTLLVDGLTVQTHTYGSEGGKDQSLTLSTQLDPNSAWVGHQDVWGTPYSPGTCASGNAFPDCTGPPPADIDPDSDAIQDTIVANCSVTPIAGDLVINEIMADPGSGQNDANQDGAFDTGDDEFVELVNVSADTLLLTGVTVEEGGGKAFTFPVATCLAPNQGAVVFGSYDSGGSFGGSLPFGYNNGSLSLNNDGDTVTIKNALGDVIDSVTYGSEGGDDQSITREFDMDAAAIFVKHSGAPLSAGALMSPGTCQNGNVFGDCDPGTGDAVAEGDTVDGAGSDDATDTVQMDAPTEEVGPVCGSAAAVGDLVINEIMSDPAGVDYNGDGTMNNTQDEFVEVVSTAAGDIDLSGVTISDATGVKYTFGAMCLPPGEAVVIFGGGTAVVTNQGATFIASASSISLNNDGDTITVKAADGSTLDTHTYAKLVGKSWARNPDGTGAFVDHSTITDTVGDASPGSCVNGGSFPTCF